MEHITNEIVLRGSLRELPQFSMKIMESVFAD